MNASSTPEPDAPSTGNSPPLWRRAVAATVAALDVVYPPTCVSCHALVEGSAYPNLCVSCARRLVLVKAPHCTMCGYPFFGAVAENMGCPHCLELRPVYREGRTLALLSGPLRPLVHALKYDRALHVLDDVAALVRANPYFASFLADAVLVPVPLFARKRRERGYNQAELIAGCFAAITGVTVQPVLKRIVDTSTQTRLDRAARQKNLKNAFALVEGAPVKASIRYVLVDDVFTTGATLNACAAVLRRAGLTAIDVATLGHG